MIAAEMTPALEEARLPAELVSIVGLCPALDASPPQTPFLTSEVLPNGGGGEKVSPIKDSHASHPTTSSTFPSSPTIATDCCSLPSADAVDAIRTASEEAIATAVEMAFAFVRPGPQNVAVN